MKNLICLISLLLTVLSPAASAAGDAKRGKDLTKECSACHGDDGNSAAANFPKLAGIGEKYLLKQLKDIKGGVRKIPEMTGLLDKSSDQDLSDIAAYFASQTTQLSGASALEVQVNSGQKVDGLKLGKDLYRAGNREMGVPACTGCHSPRGQGNSPAGYPRLSGQHSSYIEKQLKDFRAGNRVNDGDAMIMRSISKGLSDSEIKALSAYIAGLN